MRQFEKLVTLCEKYGINFNYALSPCTQPDSKKIIRKLTRMIRVGIRQFSLFYDDIQVPLNHETANTQLHGVHELMLFLNSELKDPVLFFCPTQYRGFTRTPYIETVAEKLSKYIHIFWTGKNVVSESITADDIARITRILRRPPLIWDNIFANDYIPETILRFPYYRRSKKIISRVTGILVNPMNQYEPSKHLIQTAAQFFNDPQHYVPQQAWRNVLRTQLHSCNEQPLGSSID